MHMPKRWMVVVFAVMVLILTGGVGSASAAPSENAGCGQLVALLNTRAPGSGGQEVAVYAQRDQRGVSELAKTHCAEFSG